MVLSSEWGHWLECQNLFFFLLFQFAYEQAITSQSFETICTSAEIRKMVLYLHRCFSHEYFKRCRFQNYLAETQLCYGNDHCRFSMPTKSNATGAWPNKKVLMHLFLKTNQNGGKIGYSSGILMSVLSLWHMQAENLLYWWQTNCTNKNHFQH